MFWPTWNRRGELGVRYARRSAEHLRAHRASRRCGIENLEPRCVLSAVMVADINQTGAHSTPSDFLDADGSIYFRAEDPIHGAELWKSDGTAAGTQLVADVVPGSGSSFPESMTQVGDLVFFTEGNGWKPNAVWRTDGTAAGTIRLRQFADPITRCCAQRFEFVEYQGAAYFMAFDQTAFPISQTTSTQNHASLWTSDGTPEGTTLVTFLGNSSQRTGLTVYDDRMYFVLERHSNSRPTGIFDIWESDGTAGGTDVIASFRPDSRQIHGHHFRQQDFLTYSGGAFYYAENNIMSGVYDLYKLARDGTDHWQSSLVRRFTSGRISEMRTATGGLYFLAESSGGDLWYSDGTPAGTRLIRSSGFGTGLMVAGDRAFSFHQSANPANGYELWISDGTTPGTMFSTGFVGRDVDTLFRDPVIVAGQLAFTARDTEHGLELWMSDGTAGGTRMVRDINPGPAWSNPGLLPGKLLVQGNRLFFNANDGVHGEELWTSDGSEAGTYLVKDIDEGTATASSDAKMFAPGGGTTYFTANDGVHSREVWRTDLASDATQMAFDLVPATASPFDWKGENIDEAQGSFWRSFGSTGPWSIGSGLGGSNLANRSAHYGGHYYFSTLSDSWKLYRTDGTLAGTVVVAEGTDCCSPPSHFIEVNGRLIFFAGNELFVISSPDSAPEILVSGDLLPGSPYAATRIGNLVYFQGPGHELWRTDGTLEGTVPVAEIVPGSDGSGPGPFTQIGDEILFRAYDPQHCNELWRTDGTATGTQLVADINTQPSPSGRTGCSEPGPIIEVGGTALFFANDGIHGRELWTSDGTDQGTVLVKDLVPGSEQFRWLSSAVNFNGSLLFFAEDWQFRASLWRSDGTESGTQLVREFLDCSNRDPGSAVRCKIVVHDGVAYLSAKDKAHGEELWKTDGTPEGTVLVADIWPGAQGSFPDHFYEANGNLYFVANDGLHGREPWRLSTPADFDLNGSGVVDAGDVAILAHNFGMTNGARAAHGDMDANGRIDTHDLTMLQQHLGEVVAPPASPAAAIAVAVAPLEGSPTNGASGGLQVMAATADRINNTPRRLGQPETNRVSSIRRTTRLSAAAVDRVYSSSAVVASPPDARPLRASRSRAAIRSLVGTNNLLAAL